MAFWSLRRDAPTTAPVSIVAEEQEPAMEPVQVFLPRHVVRGRVLREAERMTDILARRPALRVQEADGAWTDVAFDDIVLVAPPPHVSQRRIHRARRRIELFAEPYTITGTAHLPPGTQLDPFVLRTGRPTLPVTSAWVRIEGDPTTDQQLDVAIVNVEAISRAKELLGLA